MRAIVYLFPLLPLLLAPACGGDSNGTDEDGDATVVPDGTGDVADGIDTDTLDTGGFIEFDIAVDTGETEVSKPSADFGQPCLGNTDCQSGWCVESPDGYICTAECLEECPESYDCKSVQNAKGDVTFLCLPRVQKLCVSCLQDFQCNGGACLTIAGSKQCAAGCDEETDCPDGYTCIADTSPTDTKEGKFCQPKSGSCDCSPPFAGVTRLCIEENSLGSCRGAESCDPEVGWVGCSASVPVSELCDYIDNNCNGEVDETFKTDGVYATAESCGSCGTRCDDVLANAAVTDCVVQSGTARCQVVTCDPGYTAVNPFVCAPDASSLCQPCLTAAECLGTEAACTSLDDGDFCSLPCAENADCSTGFVCDNTENGLQCVPEFGSCTCDGSNTNLARSCTKIFTPPDPDQPVVTCKGFEQCTATGWGGCDLPDDDCDGIDNDCDGVIDGPHKTGDKYTSIEHCGACGISCLAFVRPNAAPVCDASLAVPQCGYQCAGTAVDVNGLGDDGCECVPVAGADLAGDDVDSNCDGVDGEVANAIFVSKDGDDTNPGTRELPVLTLQTGLTKATSGNKRDVYVATGVYSQNIVLAEGVGIFGGYAPEFDQHDVLLYETAIIGGTPDGTHLGTVTAINVGAAGAPKETVLDGFTIFGVNAGNIRGGNSYGVYARNSGDRLRISKNRIFGGPGGNGENGARGTDGPNGVNGTNGIAAKNLTTDCATADQSSGGVGGAQTCISPLGPTDVSGGEGGTAVCPLFETTPPASTKGSNGFGSNSGLGGKFGWPFFLCAITDAGPPGTAACAPYYFSCQTCYLPNGKAFNPTGGQNGTTGANGTPGVAGAASGSTITGEWVGSAGGKGEAGSDGSGGGGGGAAGGVEVEGTECGLSASNDDVGGSGGGGGSGGCLATGGQGGKAGGGSFGIFVVGANANHTPKLTSNTIQTGRGGAGGAGGAGGVGGAAGQGGIGGTAGDQLQPSDATRCAAGGGKGGTGGSGGHGGGGGGGAGGPSYGLYVSLPGGTAPAEWKTSNTFLGGGQGGGGGLGGVSIAQSGSGANGVDGTAANTSF